MQKRSFAPIVYLAVAFSRISSDKPQVIVDRFSESSAGAVQSSAVHGDGFGQATFQGSNAHGAVILKSEGFGSSDTSSSASITSDGIVNASHATSLSISANGNHGNAEGTGNGSLQISGDTEGRSSVGGVGRSRLLSSSGQTSFGQGTVVLPGTANASGVIGIGSASGQSLSTGQGSGHGNGGASLLGSAAGVGNAFGSGFGTAAGKQNQTSSGNSTNKGIFAPGLSIKPVLGFGRPLYPISAKFTQQSATGDIESTNQNEVQGFGEGGAIFSGQVNGTQALVSSGHGAAGSGAVDKAAAKGAVISSAV